MRTSMRADLTTALKARDRVTITALRSALTAIDNAEAPPADPTGGTESIAGHGATEVPRRQLTDGDLRAVIEAEVHERRDAAAGYEDIGRTDLAQRLRSEADVLSQYLPGQ